MTRSIGYCTLIVGFGVIICITAYSPHWINDKNNFLFNFVNHEFLSLLGVIVSLTIASTGQLHLSLNELEREAGKRFLFKTRSNVKTSAYCLIILFVAALFLVVLKGALFNEPSDWKDTAFAFINGSAIMIVLWSSLILASIIQIIFRVEPDLQHSS